jgi:glycosyltransferase involved in cell wall biosynthesis
VPAPAAARLVCVGRLCDPKRQDVLIRASAALQGRGVEHEVMLVGDGENRARLERLARSLAAPVRFLGSLDAAGVRDELHAARSLVLASADEGLPVAIMEAFALARPVIVTPVGGVTELVNAGDNGWLVAPGDIDALAAAMESALRAEPARLDEMGRAGRAAVLRGHDADREADRLARLFREYGGGSDPGRLSH